MVEFSMKVSAIILTYNRVHMVTEAIDSVLKQTFNNFELLVVDNYSNDNTESVVKSYSDKRIRYFKNQNNGFIGVNRNYGIEKSGGEYIAFLDDDDLWLPKKLEKQVELLDSNKELGLVYSDCYLIDTNGNLRENTYFKRRKPVRGNAFREMLPNNPVPMLTAVIRKDVLDKVGDFSPEYKIAQDYDLWLRIAEYYPIDFIDQPLAKYRVHSESDYHQNTVLAYQEDLQIINYWLNRNPGLQKELGGRIKALKYREIILKALVYAYQGRNINSVKESLNLLKYLLLPKHQER